MVLACVLVLHVCLSRVGFPGMTRIGLFIFSIGLLACYQTREPNPRVGHISRERMGGGWGGEGGGKRGWWKKGLIGNTRNGFSPTAFSYLSVSLLSLKRGKGFNMGWGWGEG